MPEDTENQPEFVDPGPSVVVLYDRDGREHYTGRDSQFAVSGLAKGTLSATPFEVEPEPDPAPGNGTGEQEPKPPEVPGGPEVGSTGHDPEPGTGSGDGSGIEATDPAPARGNARHSSKA